MKVISDIFDAVDDQKVTLSGLLDQSAAFETVDHDILLKVLKCLLVLVDQCWNGFVLSSLTGFQAVSFRNVISEFIPLRHGVAQGSVLDPLLFILHTADMERIAAQNGVDLHSYADDAQLYTSCSGASTSAVVLLCCINDVDIWMFIKSAPTEC